MSPFTERHGNAKYEPREASFRGLFARTKASARHRKLAWSIPYAAFVNLSQQPCIWCGAEPFAEFNAYISKNGYTQRSHPTFVITNGWIKFNGLDRILNKEGYTTDNVHACCADCNFSRRDKSTEEFTKYIQRLTRFHTCAS